ncbi:beta-keratin-related protein-like [Aquila chrysaetos chrysaetos]|uniref:beta-keratin-related protein-like n=1 Tax=Aquila chrysaetos chrysaetos TaxID=223781 RepID=UPI0011771AAA|nr:beta-keratin-related protein-like [Aquila chrysaetos chrysaetos]
MVYKGFWLRSPQITGPHLSSLLIHVHLPAQRMSSSQQLSSRCSPPCKMACLQPITNAWNQPCVTSCGDSRAVVYPPPVVITFPGPILSSCPQESFVGTSAPLGLGRPRGLQGSLIYGGSLSSSSQLWSQRYGGCGPC